jgi:hypothetical protein
MQIDHHLLVTLWDKAVTTRDYDKKQWTDLSNQVLDANHLLSELEKYREDDRESTDSW